MISLITLVINSDEYQKLNVIMEHAEENDDYYKCRINI